MAYDVDFWYLTQDACQISTDFTPFSEHEEESIYMKTSDFFKMVERFTDPDLERKAKAFDRILQIDNQATDEDRITGEYESDIETVLSEYKERVDDER